MNIEPRQSEVERLWHSLEKPQAVMQTGAPSLYDSPQWDDDLTIYNRAQAAANGPKFNDLWSGNWQAHYTSQSEADAYLFDALIFYSPNHLPNIEQLKRMFRMSALGQREKADRQDYLDRTIAGAWAGVQQRLATQRANAEASQRDFASRLPTHLPLSPSLHAAPVGPNFAPPPPAPSNVVGWGDFMADSQRPFYVVQRMLQAGSLYAFTASWGVGKTAVGVTIAMHVAAGVPLNTMKVARSKVLYLCGENPDDVKLRARAAATRFGMDWNALQGWMHFTRRPFAIDNSQQLHAFVTEAAQHGPFGLVIVDTGPAHSEAEDENDNRQMHKLAMALRDLMAPLADENNRAPATMVLMHPVKNAGRETLEPRGGGAFSGSVDALIFGWRADPGDPVEVFHRTKFRGPGFDPIMFNLEQFVFHEDTDNFGEPVKTVVAIVSDEKPVRETRLTGAALIAHDALEFCLHASGVAPNAMILKEDALFAPIKVVHENVWRARCYEVGISHGEGEAKQKAFVRARKALIDAGVIRTHADHYWLPEWVEPRTATNR